MNKDRRYFARELTKLRCDECNQWIGFYDVQGDIFDSTFICIKCKVRIEREEEEEWHIAQTEILSRKLAEKLCGEETGHYWQDVTSSTFVMGSTVYSCSRCYADKFVPYNWHSSWQDGADCELCKVIEE